MENFSFQGDINLERNLDSNLFSMLKRAMKAGWKLETSLGYTVLKIEVSEKTIFFSCYNCSSQEDGYLKRSSVQLRLAIKNFTQFLREEDGVIAPEKMTRELDLLSLRLSRAKSQVPKSLKDVHVL